MEVIGRKTRWKTQRSFCTICMQLSYKFQHVAYNYHQATKPMHVLALCGRPMSIGANLRCQVSLEGKSGPVESGLVAMALNIFVLVEDSACFTKQ